MNAPIVDQGTINSVWNRVMLFWFLEGKSKLLSVLNDMAGNPIADDMAVRIELTDKPYFIGEKR